jgi:hypothetical protein
MNMMPMVVWRIVLDVGHYDGGDDTDGADTAQLRGSNGKRQWSRQRRRSARPGHHRLLDFAALIAIAQVTLIAVVRLILRRTSVWLCRCIADCRWPIPV